eukprot:6253536-Amphidinium_carterae.1
MSLQALVYLSSHMQACPAALLCYTQLLARLLEGCHTRLQGCSRMDPRHTVDTIKRNRIWPEMYKKGITAAAHQRGNHHAGRLMLSDGAAQGTRRHWLRKRVAAYVAKHWRFFSERRTGTYHIQSDGSRIGNPGKELEVAVLARADMSGTCTGGPIPPQVLRHEEHFTDNLIDHSLGQSSAHRARSDASNTKLVVQSLQELCAKCVVTRDAIICPRNNCITHVIAPMFLHVTLCFPVQ